MARVRFQYWESGSRREGSAMYAGSGQYARVFIATMVSNIAG